MSTNLKNSLSVEVNNLPKEISDLIGGSKRALIIPLDVIEEEKKHAREIIEKYTSQEDNGVKTLKYLEEQLVKIEKYIKDGNSVMLDVLVGLYTLYDYCMLELNLVVNNNSEGKYCISHVGIADYFNDLDIVKEFTELLNDHGRLGITIVGDTLSYITAKFDCTISFKGIDWVLGNINPEDGMKLYFDNCKKLDTKVWFRVIDDYLMWVMEAIGSEYRNTYRHVVDHCEDGILKQIVGIYTSNKEEYLNIGNHNYTGIEVDYSSGEPKLVDRFNELYR